MTAPDERQESRMTYDEIRAAINEDDQLSHETPDWTDDEPAHAPIVGEEAARAIRRALADGYVDPVEHPGD